MKKISEGPYQYHYLCSTKIDLTYIVALMPAVLWSLIRYGVAAGLVLTMAILGTSGMALLGSWTRGGKKKQLSHALLTGLLIGMFLPVGVPLHVPFLTACFGYGVGALIWGNSSRFWLNPVALGLAFAIACWPTLYGGDYLGTGTHFTSDWYNLILHSPLVNAQPTMLFERMASNGNSFDWSGVRSLFSAMGMDVPPQVIQILLGFDGSLVGTSSGIILLAGSVLLIARRIIDWRVIVPVFGVFAVIVFLFGGMTTGLGVGRGDLVFFCLNGSFLGTLFFIAPHSSTLPATSTSRLYYGLLLGLLFSISALFGRLEIGYVLTVLAGNISMPLLDHIGRRKFLFTAVDRV